MALPVVARAGGQQRVEALLPAGEGHRPDHVGDRLAEAAQLRHRLLALGDVAGVAGGEDQHLAAVPFLGQERQRRRLAHHHPDGELVLGGAADAVEVAQELRRRVDRVDDEAGEDLRPELVQLELEAGHHAEVAAAAADRPEEIGVLGGAGAAQAAVGGDDVGGEQVVDGHAELAADPAEAAAEGQAGDAGGRVDAGRQREAVRLGRGVDVGEERAGLDAGGALDGIDRDGAHLREVEQERVVGDGEAADLVAAAADRQDQAVVAGEVHRGLDVAGRGGADHQAGMAVDHRVPERAGVVVAGVAALGHGAAQADAQGVDRGGLNRAGAAVEAFQCHSHVRFPSW